MYVNSAPTEVARSKSSLLTGLRCRGRRREDVVACSRVWRRAERAIQRMSNLNECQFEPTTDLAGCFGPDEVANLGAGLVRAEERAGKSVVKAATGKRSVHISVRLHPTGACRTNVGRTESCGPKIHLRSRGSPSGAGSRRALARRPGAPRSAKLGQPSPFLPI